MTSFPHLRIRTEFSFKKAFGRVDEVAARLKDIGCDYGAIVDTGGTWGHVKFRDAMQAAGLHPIYGAEVPVTCEDGKTRTAWVLAYTLKNFYNFMSRDSFTEQDFIDAPPGIIRFAGDALTDYRAFDFVDVNQRSFSGMQRAMDLAKETGRPLVLAPVNDYPAPEDFDAYMAWNDDRRMTPQHILTEEEARKAFSLLPDDVYQRARARALHLMHMLSGRKLERAPIISVDGDLWAKVRAGIQYRLEAGHIKEWSPDYEQRVHREMELIKQKQYDSYFLVVQDLVLWAKNKMLVGPARGSAAGSLVCYLLQITEVDPLPHNLLFERFIDVNRDDLPDIDIDFNDQKRPMVFDYLREKYGARNVAKIGNVLRLKPRSVLAHAGKKMNIPAGATFPVVNVLIEYPSGDPRFGHSLIDTMTTTEPGRDFLQRYPRAELMDRLENHASHTGVHAAGIIVCNVPVTDYCTVQNGIAQVDKKDAEKLNLLKIDVLGLRTLGIIEDCGAVDADTLYGLPLDDPNVFQVFNDGKYSGLFQFEGSTQRRVSAEIPIANFKTVDHITALARPGPLGSGADSRYAKMLRQGSAPSYPHASMAAYMAETFGLILYQEQVMKIAREIGQFSWPVVSEVRKAISGSKGRDYLDARGAEFVEGAKTVGLDEEVAAGIWEEICTFGGWGMNKSHTTSYAVISYWCAYLKCYHPVEYAAACLRAAKDDEQTLEILRELHAEGVRYVPFDPDLSEENWVARDGKVIGGFMNLKGIGPVKAKAYIEKRNQSGLNDADREKLGKLEPAIADLRPAHSLWGDVYKRPEKFGINGPIEELADFDEYDKGVIIARMVSKDRRDENEQRMIDRRGGEVRDGETRFVDMWMVDDSVSQPVRVRFRPDRWGDVGSRIIDHARNNEEWFVVRGKFSKKFNMFFGEKIMCLTNRELFK